MIVWGTAIADLLINLSAGWLGAVVIIPNFSKETGAKKLFILTGDLLAAIVSLSLAVAIRTSI